MNKILSLMFRNSFYLIRFSPWPIVGAIGTFGLLIRLCGWFHKLGLSGIFISIIIIILCIIQWRRDVIRERTYIGSYTFSIYTNVRWGIVIFIISEVLFFFSFFWAFFHRRLCPTIELGCIWPPVGIDIINPFSVPLLNTIVLLSSGITVTWCHHRLLNNNHRNILGSLILTITLGLYFTLLQLIEYIDAPFSISDRIYGRTFFVATGFHGIHVIIGSLFLRLSVYRGLVIHYSINEHFGFEAAAWYWHFVDVVWIFLYIWVYWWGS